MPQSTTASVDHPALLPVPGDAGKPIIGYTLDFIRDPIGMLYNRYRKYGEISWANLFGIKMVQMIGPDANQFVFQNRGNLFSNSQGWDYFIGKFFTRGIMLLDFEEHRHHRRIMQQAFNRSVLEEYIALMAPAISQGIGQWKPHKRFMVLPAIKQLTLDLATDVFMGEELGPESDKINKAFVDCVRGGTALIRFRAPGLRWDKGLKGRKVLEDFFSSRVLAKRSSNENDMFSQLCRAETEDGEKFSDEDVVNHMIFLMMAAHDTSTITLSVMFNYLAQHQEWQEKIRQESLALGKSQLGYEDLDNLKSIELVMKESLRLCSPVPSLPRKTVKDVEYKGHLIPEGTYINVIPYFTHHMKEWWPEPEKFDPNRFADDRREDKIHPYAWVPFGGGAHKCIGLHFADLQVKAIMHQIIQHYRWSVKPGYTMPVDTSALPIPADGLPVKMERL